MAIAQHATKTLSRIRGRRFPRADGRRVGCPGGVSASARTPGGLQPPVAGAEERVWPAMARRCTWTPGTSSSPATRTATPATSTPAAQPACRSTRTTPGFPDAGRQSTRLQHGSSDQRQRDPTGAGAGSAAGRRLRGASSRPVRLIRQHRRYSSAVRPLRARGVQYARRWWSRPTPARSSTTTR